MLPILHLGPFAFYSFGLLFGLAVCLGWFTVARYFRTHGILVNEPVLGACIVGFGLVGARLDAALVDAFLRDRSPFAYDRVADQLADQQGGYTYLGAILLGALSAVVYAWVKRLPTLRFLDALFCIGPSYAVGRIGCFLAGDGDYGIQSNLPWAMSFPHGIVPTTVRVHPTMLYSTIWELAVFAVLWRLSDPGRQPQLRPGTLLGCYLIASGGFRFLVEFLGRNPVLTCGLTEAQLVSAAMMVGGGLILGHVVLPASAWQSVSMR